jgi:hypothetical protein
MTTENPAGWNEARVQRVLEFYEAQSDEDVAAEIEAGLKSTTMEVPRALVPAVRELIASRKPARSKKTHNVLRVLVARRENTSTVATASRHKTLC